MDVSLSFSQFAIYFMGIGVICSARGWIDVMDPGLMNAIAWAVLIVSLIVIVLMICNDLAANNDPTRNRGTGT